MARSIILPPVEDAARAAVADRERGPAEPFLVRGHADVAGVAADPETFSNAVSRFRQIPNSLDGEEHGRFRALVERYFAAEEMARFAPECRRVARELVATLPRGQVVDAVAELGAPFAVRAQSAWLGWPAALERPLLDWLADKQAAMRSGDSSLHAEVATRFDALVLALVEARRGSDGSSDLTDRLIHDDSAGRPLESAEVVSILRNWTGGDLGTMALATGVLVHFLATHPDIAGELRDRADDARFDAAIEEMLRRDDPFVASRRIAAREAEVAGCPVAVGRRLVLDWTAANRDPRVFDPPDGYDPERNASASLVYGAGPHACPGRPLARLELRELVRALLATASTITLAGDPVRESAPLGGFRSVPVRLADG